MTEAHIARVPPENLRVPPAEFAAVWVAAERRSHERAAAGDTDWYAAGVSTTCRWLACATVPGLQGRRALALSPVTERTVRAYEELIEAEFLAAQRLDLRRPRPEWLEARPGWIEAINTTLRWAWRRDGPAPDLASATTAVG